RVPPVGTSREPGNVERDPRSDSRVPPRSRRFGRNPPTAGASRPTRALHVPPVQSESRQALRAVVRDRDACDLAERTVRLRGVPDELRSVSVDLIQVGAVRREPVVAWPAADVATERPERAVSRNLGASGVLRDFQTVAVDLERADVAVAE